MSTKDDLLRLIRLVDDDFKRPDWSFRFSAHFPLIAGTFLLLIANWVWVTYVRNGLPTDTILLALTLVVIADSYAIDLLLHLESSGRRRRIRASTHFDCLIKTKADPLILMALVKMKVCLPNNVSLKTVYDRDSTVFTIENLVRRTLEPLP